MRRRRRRRRRAAGWRTEQSGRYNAVAGEDFARTAVCGRWVGAVQGSEASARRLSLHPPHTAHTRAHTDWVAQDKVTAGWQRGRRGPGRNQTGAIMGARRKDWPKFRLIEYALSAPRSTDLEDAAASRNWRSILYRRFAVGAMRASRRAEDEGNRALGLEHSLRVCEVVVVLDGVMSVRRCSRAGKAGLCHSLCGWASSADGRASMSSIKPLAPSVS